MTDDMNLWLPAQSDGRGLSSRLEEAETFLLQNGFAICQSKVMKNVYAKVVKYAKARQPVLLLGPTGCGKEIIARMVHSLGENSNEPFVDLNCGSFSEALVESQLFGHRKGAFTGALSDKTGFFEDVGQGCIFLDEVGELPLALQPRLLRVLENRNFRPLGSTHQRQFNGRVIAATNRDISHMVENDLFRKDLIHRLNTFTIEIPPLGRHMEDIPILTQHFLDQEKSALQFEHNAFSLLFQYDWPGNIRELKNTIDRIVAICETPTISPAILESAIYGECRFTSIDETMEEISERLLQLDLGNRFNAIEHHLVDVAMRKAEGKKAKAARLLGVHRKAVERRVKHLEDLVKKAQVTLEKGRGFMRESNYETAISHYEEALEILRELPMKADYSDMRYEALSKLSICQRNLDGWISEDVLSTYDEAMQLGKMLGREQELISVTFGLWTARLMALDLPGAKDIASELLAQGEKLKSSEYRVQAYLAIANTDFWLGNFSGVFTASNSFYAIYEFHEDMLLEQGMDPFALCVMLDGLAAFQSGQFDRARTAITKGLEHANTIDHPFSLAISLQAACWLEWLFQNKQASRARAEELVALSTDNGFSFYCGLGEVFLGRAMVDQGEVSEGIDLMRQGYLDKMMSAGGKLFYSFYSLLLAESMVVAGELREAQAILEDAMNIAQAKSEMCYLSELICAKGRVHALQGKDELAAAEFQRAAHTALPIQSNFAYFKGLYELAKHSVGTRFEAETSKNLTNELERRPLSGDHPMLTEIQQFVSKGSDVQRINQSSLEG